MVQKNARGETWITEKQPLHDDEGRLAAPGYALSMLYEYDKARIKASKFRIKEWDYYLINDEEYAVALTLNDMGYLGMLSASVLSLTDGTFKTSTALTALPMGKFNMPTTTVEGVSAFENKQVSFCFKVADGKRVIEARFAKFDGEEELAVSVVLDEEPRDSMVIATPWAEDPQAFYFNQKIIAMRAAGSFTKGSLTHEFDPENSFGLLDWGRGVWTRDNTWYWSAAQGWQTGVVETADEAVETDDAAGKAENGNAAAAKEGAREFSEKASETIDETDEGGRKRNLHRFGFNLGYGFGDTTAASENMVFVDGVAHKLGRVTFGIPELPGAAHAKKLEERYDFLQPWRIFDDEGRLDLAFMPLTDRKDYTDFAVIISDQHQVFGTFNGHVVLDDGSRFEVRGLKGFAEAVRNKY